MPFEVDPAEFFREFAQACCDDQQHGHQARGCPHLVTDHTGGGPCQVAGCQCTGLTAHRDNCVHQVARAQHPLGGD